MNPGDLARRLLAVREGAPLIGELNSELKLESLAEAYRVADSVVAALETNLGRVSGFKVGATSLGGQKLLGLGEPFYGRICERKLLANDAVWGDPIGTCTVEAEIGFVLCADLPPRAQAYSPLEVRTAIGLALPLLEINRPAYSAPLTVGGLALIADNGVTQGLVMGTPGHALHAAGHLADETVTLSRNAKSCAQGQGAVVLGDPLNAVIWLANALRQQGRGLHTGEVIASGAMTQHVRGAPGDTFTAEYSTLGRVAVHFQDI
ncbi:MAG TPA: hypothetical protein VGD63_04885 [Steroidobacteraceae bacterium]